MKRLTPPSLPLPALYLIDSHKLMRELDRIRNLVLGIPVSEASHSATQSAVDAIWRLRTNLEEILRVQGEIHQSWQRRSEEHIKANEPPRIGLRVVQGG